jgi:hypothetical protein
LILGDRRTVIGSVQWKINDRTGSGRRAHRKPLESKRTPVALDRAAVSYTEDALYGRARLRLRRPGCLTVLAA